MIRGTNAIYGDGHCEWRKSTAGWTRYYVSGAVRWYLLAAL